MFLNISVGVSKLVKSGELYDAILESRQRIRVFRDLRPGEHHQTIGCAAGWRIEAVFKESK